MNNTKKLIPLVKMKIWECRFYSSKKKAPPPPPPDNVLTKYEAPQIDAQEELYPVRRFEEDDMITIEGKEDVGVVSGMPDEYRKRRTAIIYQRPKNVMQQGVDNTKEWILDFGNEQRWENPCMGWASSGDSLSNIYLEFPSMCAAVCYAEKQGLKWQVGKPHVKKPLRKVYADNFPWNRRTRVSTK